MLARKWASLLVFVATQCFVLRQHLIVTTAFLPSRQLVHHPIHHRTRTSRKLFSSSSSDNADVVDILSEADVEHLSSLVNERAEARSRGDYALADSLKDTIYESISLPQGISLEIRDVSRKEGGGSTWKLVRNAARETPMEGPTVLQLAHAALGLAISKSSSQDSSQDLKLLVQQAKERLQQTELVQVELFGRKSVDAAFWFALSGATDKDLFSSLAEISGMELSRYGTKSSCRTKDVWHVLERLAAAGIRSDVAVEKAAVAAFKSKNASHTFLTNDTSSDLLNFHSDRCLLMIWKFSTRQRKQRAFLQSAVKHWEQQHSSITVDDCESALDSNEQKEIPWPDLYKDPHRPLVIDVGCGMGVSLLGLARGRDVDVDSCPFLDIDLKTCNFAGVDLSGLAIGYARGLSHRWGMNDRLHFFVDNAESFLEKVINSYPGPLRFCLVQFPTPYRLPNAEKEGNSQLPSDETSGFMVTERLLQLLRKALCPTSGTLLLQSNCEDVAVFMRQIACQQVGFECIETSDLTPCELDPSVKIPKRTLDWIAMGGTRAEGSGWSSKPLLPRIGRTETEVACMANGTPVHRCLLRVPCSSDTEV